MNFLLLLLTVGFSLAAPRDNRNNVVEDFATKNYPEVITDIDTMDVSNLSIKELLVEASHHPGLEFMNDSEAAAEMGINLMNIHRDLIIDAFSSTCQLAERRGYDCEIHRIKTSDEYILEIHRIRGDPVSPPRGKRAVFLEHGLLDSSATWVLMGVGKGLGYILSDLGYDVWMANARGNRYSRKHTKYNPDGGRADRRHFFDFSWHEIGIIDLPATIDYITQVTGERRMHYVGHSQGTTSFFIMCSERREYNERIISAHMLAPVAFMSRLFSPYGQIGSFFQNILFFEFNLLGIYEYLPRSEFVALVGQIVCKDGSWLQLICSNGLFLVGGFNSKQLNKTMLPVISGHAPAGAAVKQIIHYAQGIRSGLFRQFDFGFISNYFKYGSLSPPQYNLTNIVAPTTFYYSTNDWLSDPRDVRELHDKMTGGRPTLIKVADPGFNHLDYIWGIDVKALVYDKVVQIMKEHETNKSVITDIDMMDVSNLSIEELLVEASHHPGLEFMNDSKAAAEMGIDLMKIDSDLIIDAVSSTCQLVKRRGYDCEIHRIKTSDGYILEIHRIRGGPVSPPNEGKRVVFLEHGLTDSSATWVLMGVGKGLGYILSDLGYDVWMANARGNRYSRKHTKYNPDGGRADRRHFFNFTWHEIGIIDLPATIDYITQVTGEKRMHYVGHSQGTTSFFIMCSERREYNERIISAHMFAPVAFMSRLFSPFLRIASCFQNILYDLGLDGTSDDCKWCLTNNK
ncbi:Lipase 3, partial [Pseudolycoriella hygida]